MWLRPHLLGLHLFAVAAVLFSIFMGLWQLGVYDARQADERADRGAVPTVPLVDVWGPGEPLKTTTNQRPVTVTGHFADSGQQVWIAGKSVDSGEKGAANGFWLTAPFRVDGDEQPGTKPTALMVVRGWSAEAAPVVPVPSGELTIRVVLQPGETGSGTINAARVAEAVRIPAFINEFDYDLYSGFGLNTSTAAAGSLALVQPPEPESSWTAGSRNLMYGIQWFVFGLFAIFMWWRMSTENVAAARGQVT